ncbi:MAG: ribosomal-processing cysteine protease Prp [Thermaerobacterales bacterium]
MVHAVFQRDSQGAVSSFTLDGHTGLAPHGHDLVCAAVSALGQGILIGLEAVVGLDVQVEVAGGRLRCTLPAPLPDGAGDQAAVLLETLVLSLRSIERDHEDALQVRELHFGKGGGSDALH